MEQSEGQSIVMLAQDSVLVGVDPAELAFALDIDGQAIVTVDGFEDPIRPGGGRLAGLLSARNEIIGQFKEKPLAPRQPNKKTGELEVPKDKDGNPKKLTLKFYTRLPPALSDES